MRPRILEEYIGQEHIVGEGKLLRRAIEADRLFSSIILWGPPVTGKITLAQVIANSTKSHFVTISAILAGKADLHVVIDGTFERRRLHNEKDNSFCERGSGNAKFLKISLLISKPEPFPVQCQINRV